MSTRVVSEERVCSPRLHPFREIGYESYTEDEGHEGDLDVEEKKKIARKKSTLAMEEGKKEIEKKQETASPRSPLQVESGPSVTKSTEESNETLDPSRRRRRGPGPTRLAVFSVPRKPPQDLEEERSQEPPESTGKKRQLVNLLHSKIFSFGNFSFLVFISISGTKAGAPGKLVLWEWPSREIFFKDKKEIRERSSRGS